MGVTRSRPCVLRIALALVLVCLIAVPVVAKDSEKKLLEKLARESNPVKKAKLEIRLARLKLLQSVDARENDDFEGCLSLLGDYRDRIDSAWDILKSTGRDAHKKPGGFKQLEIEIREDSRYLEDLRRSFSVMDREPVDKIIQDVEGIRAEVIKALFPTMARPNP